MTKNSMLDTRKTGPIDLNSTAVKIRYANIWKLMVDTELLTVAAIT